MAYLLTNGYGCKWIYLLLQHAASELVHKCCAQRLFLSFVSTVDIWGCSSFFPQFPEDFAVPSAAVDGDEIVGHFYAGIGNAVIPPVVSAVGEELMKVLL